MSSGMTYHKYLQLDNILNAQDPLSKQHNKEAHDEMLFIITQQSCELWFKQILHELDSIFNYMSEDVLDERYMYTIIARLNRCVKILKNIIEQTDILESMTALDYLDFRDYFENASGFQSKQFRLLENKLGLRPEDRMTYGQCKYSMHLSQDHKVEVEAAETSPNLFELIENWLERTPFLTMKEFDFWDSYISSVKASYSKDEKNLDAMSYLSEKDKKQALALMDLAMKSFSVLFDESKFNAAKEKGDWRLSYKAVRAALLIQLYRDQPVFQLPFALINALQDIDSVLTQWRYRHSLLVQRILGAKSGSGGSPGSVYLQATASKHRVFKDFDQLSSFLVAREVLPVLPKEAQERLGFHFNSHTAQPSS